MGQHGARIDNLAPDKYRSAINLTPRSRATKEKYFSIYQDYVLLSLTERQLAEKWKMSLDHVSRCIKWVCLQTDTGDYSTYYKTTVDKLSFMLQDIEIELQRPDLEISEKTSMWGEKRRIIKLMAQIQKVIGSGIEVNINNQPKTAVVVMSDGMDRRTGDSGQIGTPVIVGELEDAGS